jgi:hypothetical protein
MISNPIWEAVVEFFTQDGWAFIQSPDQPILNTKFASDHGDFICFGKVREAQSQFVFYTSFPTKIPEDKRLAIAELLTRANSGMVAGNFEMDFEGGDVFHKVSIDVDNDRLTPALVENMVYSSVFSMEKYFPAMMAVLYGDASPQDAIAKVEEQV